MKVARLLVVCMAKASRLAFAEPPPAEGSGNWQSAARAPQLRSEIAVAAIDSRAYVIGDYNGATDLLIYDMAHDKWTKGAPFPHAVHHAMAVAAQGRVYVFGGYVDGWTATSQVWTFDPAANRWQRRGAMPSDRAAAGATILDGKSIDRRQCLGPHEYADA